MRDMGNRISQFHVDKLGRYAEIFPGFAFKSERFTDDPADVALVKGENVQQGFIDWSESKYWPIVDADSFSKFELRVGDIVLAMDRPWVTAGLKWAHIKRHDPRALLVQRVSRLRAKNGLNQTYLRCVISSRYFSDYIQPIVTGVNVPHISGKQISDVKIPLPPPLIQQKIAAILSAYDELIDNNQRRIALLEKMAEEIYREWFVRLRFPGHEKVRFFKGVPQGWRPSCLGNIAKFTMGQSPSSEFYNEVGNGLPFHQGVGTYGERFPRTVTYCSEDGRRAHSGDILFSVRAPVGRLNIADQEMIIGRGLAAIRHKKEHNSYLFYLLKTAFANEDIIGNGSIFNSVGKDELAKFPVFEPEPSLVERFDAMVSKIDKQITMVMQATECSKSSRDALLPRLISGKLSVENLDIQFPPGMAEEQLQVA